MWNAFKSTVLETLDSKKAMAIVALVTARIAASVAGWIGLTFNQAEFDSVFDRVTAVVIAYVAAQGYADHGKAIAEGNVKAAAISAATPPPALSLVPPTPAAPAPTTPVTA